MRPLLAFLPLLLQAQPYDLVLKGGHVIDGTGNPWFRADVAVRGGRIAAVGDLSRATAQRVIDVTGHIVAPGFIDMMGAGSVPLLLDPRNAESKLRQGITTMMAGEGSSPAPMTPKLLPREAVARGFRWSTYAEYNALLEKVGLAVNVVHNVGAAQVREAVIGDQDREPTPAELDRMKQLVAEAMRDGAVGLSTALIYPPGTFAKTRELVELAKVTAPYGGFYSTHMRNESGQLLEAIEESIGIGAQAGVPVHIYHLKAAGAENWPLMAKAIARIQKARDGGMDVTADIYPYVRNGLGLVALLHPRHSARGAAALRDSLDSAALRAEMRREMETTSDWENWYRHVGQNWDNVLVAQLWTKEDKQYEGKSVAAIAKLRNEDEWTAFFTLVKKGASVNPLSMNEEQKRMALQTEWISLCTDSGPASALTATGAHPRAFGSFARVLAKYVREEKVLTLEAAVRKMSSLAANRLRLFDRGRVSVGQAADLVVFHADRVRDTATFTQPLAYPAGMPYVIVNGVVAIDNSAWQGTRSGQVLKPIR